MSEISENYNLKISTKKTKMMAFREKYPIGLKIVINNEAIEQVSRFNYLGCVISYEC